MLEIKKGKSTRIYENEFFRQFAKKLSSLFKDNDLDGLLLGMPECLTREELQIDSLLITNDSIVIIDFKNYQGELYLPSEEAFKDGSWRLNNGVFVRGGSSANPFMQLEKQRMKLSEELGNRIPSFEINSVYTLVCFQNEIQLIGEIPGKYQLRFMIADNQNYLDKLFDMLDILTSGRNYLSEDNRSTFLNKIFNCSKYAFENNNKVFKDTVNSNIDLKKPNELCLEKIEQFLKSGMKVFSLYGTTKSGKTNLIPFIRELGFKAGYAEVSVLTYSKRYKTKLLNCNPELEEVESLYSTIYDLKNDRYDNNHNKVISIKNNNEENLDLKKLIIIEESQLISNTEKNSNSQKFGSGFLLNDLFSHFNLNKHQNYKIVFIGDKNKISYGSPLESAVNKKYVESLLRNLELESNVEEFELPESKSDSQIINTCQMIAKKIKEEKFNNLVIRNNESVRILNDNEQDEILNDVYTSPMTSKIIVYTNEQALKVNLKIKKNIAKNGDRLSIGDYIILNSPTYAYLQNNISGKKIYTSISRETPLNINNGVIGKILYIDEMNKIEKSIFTNEEWIKLTFLPTFLQLKSGEVVNCFVFSNYLESTQNDLKKSESIAYEKLLLSLESEAMAKEPFSSSAEFDMMMNSRDFIEKIEDSGKTIYRDTSDNRKRTPFENAYRLRIIDQLISTNSEYFKILHAVKAKYAWCITLHKALPYSIDDVYLYTDHGSNHEKTNAEYFKWLYTGFSIAQSHVSLINWKTISPYIHTDFSKIASTGIPKEKNLTMTFTNGEIERNIQLKNYLNTQLSTIGGEVTRIDSKLYMEQVDLIVESEIVQLLFYYNKNGEVSLPKLHKGNQNLFNRILHILKSNDTSIILSIHIDDVVKSLDRLLKLNGIETQIIFSRDWQVVSKFTNDKREVVVQIWFNNKGMISKFIYMQGNDELYESIICIIKYNYIN